MNQDQLKRMKNDKGFIAALDQSGGSTPNALKAYGVNDDAWGNDDEMFDLVHEMRTRIMTSPSFVGENILGAILFEMTMDRQVEGQNTADYLWQKKQVIPFLKVDKGLKEEANGVQLMKPLPDLADLLAKAKQKNVFGTKMRSVIKEHNPEGIAGNVSQQFEVAMQIVAAGLVPIIEPEVDIHATDKAVIETELFNQLENALDKLKPDQLVMFKLTLPEQVDLYHPFTEHPNVVRMVALSGGYSRKEATDRLARNHDVVASFSRALAEGLSANQSNEEFNKILKSSVTSIAAASNT